MSPHISQGYATGCGHFTTTHWTVVMAAGEENGGDSLEALETLCRAYWQPLYAYIRRRGATPHDAQDLTQKFFERLLDKHFLRCVDRRKGKFRSFLLATLEHFLANEWRNARAQKRGGEFRFVQVEAGSPEEAQWEVAAGLTPGQVYEQQWATTLLDTVLGRLESEFAAAGKERLFEATKIFLTGERRAGSYGALALELGTTEAALKMAVSRMRRRYAELLREEVAATVSTPAEVEEEIRSLLAALSV